MSEKIIAVTSDKVTNMGASLVFSGLGLYLIIASQEFEDAGRSTPIFIGVGLIVLSVLLVLSSRFTKNPSRPAHAAKGSQWRRSLFVLLMGAWILFIPYFGFLVSGAIMFALVAASVPKAKRWSRTGLGLHAVAGAITTFCFWFLLTHLLNTPLPKPILF